MSGDRFDTDDQRFLISSFWNLLDFVSRHFVEKTRRNHGIKRSFPHRQRTAIILLQKIVCSFYILESARRIVTIGATIRQIGGDQVAGARI